MLYKMYGLTQPTGIMTKNRRLIGLIQHRISEKDLLIQVIIGSRQEGKTTVLQAALLILNHV